MAQWYAVRTATRRERTAAEGLAERRFTVYVPMQKRWRTLARGSGREETSSPLIPGYLFVLCDPEDFAVIHDIEAVHAFVTATFSDDLGRPIVFPMGVIHGLMADERAGVFDYTRHVKAEYRPKKGERVKVTAGTWLGFIGKVLETPRGKRVHVMIEGPHGRGETFDIKNVVRA